MKYKSFQDVYLHNLEETYFNPQFTNMPRGQRSFERLNFTFTLENPIERVCYSEARKTNIVFNFAECLWYLSGKNDLDFISYYAGNMRKYSFDGATLPGTGYGAKLFSYGSQMINQWERLIDLFNEDRDTKRAFIAIFDANENLSLENIDVSCTIGLQFFIRDGSLYATSYMRANDAYRGIVSDVFSFTLIQEILANQLGLRLGDYCHNAATTHIYDSDIENVKEVLKSKDIVANFSFPKMPEKDNWNDIRTVLKYEVLIRKNLVTLDRDALEAIEVDHYWRQVLIMLSLYQKIVRNKVIDAHLFVGLDPIFQHFIKIRWINLFEGGSKP